MEGGDFSIISFYCNFKLELFCYYEIGAYYLKEGKL